MLKSLGLKDPWLRNGVWRFDRRTPLGWDSDFVRTEISFSNLQLQPFDTANGKMIYNHVDCNNWFTVPILLGLTVFFLLVILLLYGFYMVAGITTPDRFDDPRISKLLQIPQE